MAEKYIVPGGDKYQIQCDMRRLENSHTPSRRISVDSGARIPNVVSVLRIPKVLAQVSTSSRVSEARTNELLIVSTAGAGKCQWRLTS